MLIYFIYELYYLENKTKIFGYLKSPPPLISPFFTLLKNTNTNRLLIRKPIRNSISELYIIIDNYTFIWVKNNN